jgi:hypothetical protein
MAFHPFQTFRKHRTTAFALLTIMCMLTFVLCSGGRDKWALDLLVGVARLFGWHNTKDPNVLVIPPDRKVANPVLRDVTASQLDEIRTDYLINDQAMQYILFPAINHVMEEEAELRKKGFEQGTVERLGELQRKKNDIDVQAAAHFGQVDTTHVDGLLDVRLWRQQAELLGLNYSADDLNAEIKKMSDGQVDLADVIKKFEEERHQGYDRDRIVKALNNTFRVAAAQKAVLGQGPFQTLFFDPNQFGGDPRFAALLRPWVSPPPLRKPMLPVSPADLWKRYQEQRDGVDVALLKVPVPPPVTGVPPTPQEEEVMKALFRQYKNTEPNPNRPEPGFKVPRRVKVEWVSGRSDTPYFREQGEKMLPQVQALQIFGSSAQLLTAANGGTPAYAANLAAALLASRDGKPTDLDPLVAAVYEEMKTPKISTFERAQRGPFDVADLTQPNFILSYYSARPRPEDVAGLVGSTSGAVGTLANPLTAVLAYQAGAWQHHAKDPDPVPAANVKRVSPALAATVALSGSDLNPYAVLATWSAAGSARQTLPLEDVRDVVVSKAYATFSQDLMVAKLKEFQKEVESRKAKPDDARFWLDHAVMKDYGINHHEIMPEVMNRYDLGDPVKDPALAPLREAYLRLSQGDPKGERFADLFFNTGKGLYDPQQYPPNQPGMMPGEKGAWELADEPFLYWRADDKAPVVPEYDEAVKKEAEAALRLKQARDKALEQAKKVEEAVKQAVKAGGDAKGILAQLKDVAVQQKLGDPVTLYGVARQVPEPNAAPGPRQFAPYKFPEDVPNVGGVFLDRLVTLKDPPGNTKIIPDEPAKNYYVAVLLQRHPASVEDFYRIYEGGKIFQDDTSRFMQEERLLSPAVLEARTKYQEEVRKQMRIDAGADENGNFEVTPEVKKRFERSKEPNEPQEPQEPQS